MPTCDAHIDIPWNIHKFNRLSIDKPSATSAFSIEQAKQGGLDSTIFALYLSDSMQDHMNDDQVDDALSVQFNRSANAPGTHMLYRGETFVHNKFNILYAMEGGRLLRGQLTNLLIFPIHYLTLLHNRDNLLGGSATDGQGGLTAFGKQVVKYCEQCGIKVDLSHSSDKVVSDVLGIATKPVMATHSGYHGLVRHPRNLKHAQIRKIVDTGGFIGVPFAKRFIGHYTIADHIAYMCDIIGDVKHVGIGSDIDGADMVENFHTVSDWHAIIYNALSDKGYSDEDISDIAGNNLLRVLGAI